MAQKTKRYLLICYLVFLTTMVLTGQLPAMLLVSPLAMATA